MFGGDSGGGFGGASSLMGGEKEEPIDTQASLGTLSALREQMVNQQPLQQTPIQDAQPMSSSVIDPTLDQLISHFGIGPQKAQGEIGELLKKGGY